MMERFIGNNTLGRHRRAGLLHQGARGAEDEIVGHAGPVEAGDHLGGAGGRWPAYRRPSSFRARSTKRRSKIPSYGGAAAMYPTFTRKSAVKR